MADFRFQGDIPGSKSVFNRALIVQSYFPSMQLQGFAGCDDVRFMREGLQQLLGGQSHIDCGEGGTTFRFMALRASRQKGVHVLQGTPRLMARPQKGLLHLLHQLGVQAEIIGNEMHIRSEGWKKPQGPLKVDTSESSQYASALILNAWLLDFDLQFELVGAKVSESYFTLTLELLKHLGMVVHQSAAGFMIPEGQRLSQTSFEVEADLSSMFTIAAAGALAGTSIIENFPQDTRQPDSVFVDIFKKMNIETKLHGRVLEVRKNPAMTAADCNLFQSPDLFPVLAVVCSWAQGVSKLHGAPHLVSKESNRIAKVSDLFKLLGIQHEVLSDGMIIHGNPQQVLRQGVEFNPDQDHRMVMAATLMKLKGHDIHIEHPEAINKSFPEFWDMIGMKA